MNLETDQFESWEFHDATLKTIIVDWQAKICTIMLAAFLEVGRDAIDCAVRWDGVTSIEISRRSPWGESVRVNQQKLESGNDYVIEMQSGDEIRIKAAGVKLEW